MHLNPNQHLYKKILVCKIKIKKLNQQQLEVFACCELTLYLLSFIGATTLPFNSFLDSCCYNQIKPCKYTNEMLNHTSNNEPKNCILKMLLAIFSHVLQFDQFHLQQHQTLVEILMQLVLSWSIVF